MIFVYILPIWEGKVMMPYKQWGQHEGYCEKLIVDFSNSVGTTIGCIDSDWTEFLTKQWKWTIEGRNLGTDLPDLVKIGYRQMQENRLEVFYRQ